MRDMYAVIDDLFRVFENIHQLLCHWTGESLDALVAEVLKLDPLEAELSEIVGSWKHARLIKISIYHTIFPHVDKPKPTKPRSVHDICQCKPRTP